MTAMPAGLGLVPIAVAWGARTPVSPLPVPRLGKEVAARSPWMKSLARRFVQQSQVGNHGRFQIAEGGAEHQQCDNGALPAEHGHAASVRDSVAAVPERAEVHGVACDGSAGRRIYYP